MSQWLNKLSNINPIFQNQIVSSILIILILWIIYFLIMKIIRKRVKDLKNVYYWRKSILYFTVTTGIFGLFRVWFEGFESIATYLGLLSAGLTIALKDLITNIAGWLFIIWRTPFKVGDRIEIDNHKGDVIDVEIFMFTLLEIGDRIDAEQSTGRMIQIPNNIVFNKPIANYTKGFQYIWNELPVLITFESDWKKSKKILLDIVNEHFKDITPSIEKQIKQANHKYLIFYSKLTPTVYTSVKDSGVLLTLRYLCSPRNRRGTEQTIWESVLDKFSANNDIDFAYPTQRFYNNKVEGKIITGNKFEQAEVNPDKMS